MEYFYLVLQVFLVRIPYLESKVSIRSLIEITIWLIVIAFIFYRAGVTIPILILQEVIVTEKIIPLSLSLAYFISIFAVVIGLIFIGQLINVEFLTRYDKNILTSMLSTILNNKVWQGMQAFLLHFAIIASCLIYIMASLEAIILGKITLAKLLFLEIFNEKGLSFSDNYLTIATLIVFGVFALYFYYYYKDDNINNDDRIKKNEESIKRTRDALR